MRDAQDILFYPPWIFDSIGARRSCTEDLTILSEIAYLEALVNVYFNPTPSSIDAFRSMIAQWFLVFDWHILDLKI